MGQGGVFQLPRCIDGTYRLLFVRTSDKRQIHVVDQVKVDPRLQAIDLTSFVRFLQVRVLDAENKPVVQCQVRHLHGDSSWNYRTDREGRVTFRIPGQASVIEVQCPGTVLTQYPTKTMVLDTPGLVWEVHPVHIHPTSPWLVAALLCLGPLSLGAQSPQVVKKRLPIPGEVFAVAGRTAFLILPPKRRSNGPMPWVWYAPTLPGLPAKAEKWMFDQFLTAGIAIAGVDVGESNGNPNGRRIYSALHKELTEKRGMARRACLLARSRGGLMLYNWAVEHPTAVACIAGIYPVCNLTSWPGLAKACGAYEMTATQLAKSLRRHNPIDRLAPLARAKVPIFHIHGDRDRVVPLAQNSGELRERYAILKGEMVLKTVKGQGHNMWRGWFECQELVDFVITHARAGSQPGTTRGIIDIRDHRRPAGALQLVGSKESKLVPEKPGTESKWTFEDGVLTASPQWDSVITTNSYRDFRMHLEFNVNEVKGTDPEKNGNSGVYIQQRYELQILNSYGVAATDYKASYCGSLYRLKKPDRLANKKAGEWQSFDIAFRAARYDGEKKIENARITAYQNQQLIHDDFEIPRKTGAGKREGSVANPIKLQGHHNRVRFRNVWIQVLNLDLDAQRVPDSRPKKPKSKGYTYVIPFDNIPPAPALTPAQALKTFKLHEDFEISVAASDPMIQSPVAIRFDGDGRMWVVEMRAYMLNARGEGEERPIGRISILTDTDQDGVFDHRSVFLDDLVLPRSIALYKNGILYGGHRKLFFVENVHDKAGKMTVIDEQYTSNQNVEHRTNGLLRGLDNWIYNVKSNARYREIDGKWVKERTTYRGQWGMSQDNYGRLYYNENWFGMKADQLLPNTLMRNPNYTKKMGDTVTLSYRDQVFPARITPGVNRGGEGAIDAKGYLTAVTAACGPVCYRGDQFPPRFRNTAFFCEPSAHFVRMLSLTETDGLTTGKHALHKREFLASTDERFRPVNLCNAPDGSLFLVDLYHGVLQHRAYLTAYLREHVKHRKLESQPRLGRVYRIRYRDNKLGPRPRMLSESSAKLVENLAHPNGWWRDTAQQLIIDRGDRTVVPALNALAADQTQPLGQIHAMWTLEGLAALNITAIYAALQSRHPRVQEMAIRLSESLTDASDLERLIPRFVALAKQTDTVVLRQLAASLGRFPGDETLMLLKEILAENISREYFREVAIHGLAGKEGRFVDLLGSELSDQKLRSYLQHCLSIKTTAAAYPMPRNKAQLAAFRRGEKMFITNCMACHGPDGKGLPMLGPPLVGSEWTTGSPSRLAAILLQGMMGPIEVDGKEYIPVAAMPGLKQSPDIGDQQLADVATFIRFAWGNKRGRVSPKQIATVRKTLKNRQAAFSAAELRTRYPK